MEALGETSALRSCLGPWLTLLPVVQVSGVTQFVLYRGRIIFPDPSLYTATFLAWGSEVASNDGGKHPNVTVTELTLNEAYQLELVAEARTAPRAPPGAPTPRPSPRGATTPQSCNQTAFGRRVTIPRHKLTGAGPHRRRTASAAGVCSTWFAPRTRRPTPHPPLSRSSPAPTPAAVCESTAQKSLHW